MPSRFLWTTAKPVECIYPIEFYLITNHLAEIKNFTTQKIAISIERIYLGINKCLYLGNIDAAYDWSHLYNYIKAT